METFSAAETWYSFLFGTCVQKIYGQFRHGASPQSTVKAHYWLGVQASIQEPGWARCLEVPSLPPTANLLRRVSVCFGWVAGLSVLSLLFCSY
jgi:hypothetical protein